MYGRRWPAGKTGSVRSAPVSCRQYTGLSQMGRHYSGKDGAFYRRGAHPRDKHDVIAFPEFWGKGPVSFPNHAAAAVPRHGGPNLFAGRDSHPGHAQAVFPHIGNQGGMLDGHRFVRIHPLTLSLAVVLKRQRAGSSRIGRARWSESCELGKSLSFCSSNAPSPPIKKSHTTVALFNR